MKAVHKTLRDATPLIIFIIGFQLFRYGMKAAVTLYLPVYLVGNGHSLWFAGIALSILQLAGAVGVAGAGHVSDKLSHKTVLLIISVSCPIILWLITLADTRFMIPLLIAMGLMLFASGPVMLAIVNDTKSDLPMFVNGLYMTIGFGISAVTTLLVGWLGDRIGLVPTFKLCAISAFMAIPFIFILPGSRRGSG